MITRLRNILLATDMTAAADRAFDRAIRLAQSNGASLSVFHAVDTNLLQPMFVKQELREAKANLLREIHESLGGQQLKVSAHVENGDPDLAIVERAKRARTDLIVMGAPDYRNLSAAFRGTTVDRVVRAAPCPVLAVKRRPWKDYGSIVAALDFGEPSRAALELVLRLFPHTEVSVVHIHESAHKGPTWKSAAQKDPSTRDRIGHIVRACCRVARRPEPGDPGGPTVLVKRGTARKHLQNIIDRSNPDLLVMGTHGRKGVAKLFLGSVAEVVLSGSRCDMLVVRA